MVDFNELLDKYTQGFETAPKSHVACEATELLVSRLGKEVFESLPDRSVIIKHTSVMFVFKIKDEFSNPVEVAIITDTGSPEKELYLLFPSTRFCKNELQAKERNSQISLLLEKCKRSEPGSLHTTLIESEPDCATNFFRQVKRVTDQFKQNAEDLKRLSEYIVKLEDSEPITRLPELPHYTNVVEREPRPRSIHDYQFDKRAPYQ